MTLRERLAAVLPEGEQFNVVQLQSIPAECLPLTSLQNTDKTASVETKTVNTQHFFTLSHNEKVFYALELIIYIVIDEKNGTAERIVFISKADTNGYCDAKVSIGQVTQSILDYILAIDPKYYLKRVKKMHPDLGGYSDLITPTTTTKRALQILSERCKNGQYNKSYIKEEDLFLSINCQLPIKTKIALFTRPEPQYLFPDSSKNPKKHILSGDQLLKWWLSIIDTLIVRHFSTADTKATVQIPGEDKSIIKHYFRNTSFKNWEVGNIMSNNPNDLAINKIPIYPDDPKGRFLEELQEDAPKRLEKMKILSFWVELQARQEFRLGVVVSVIGVFGSYISPYSIKNPSSEDTVIPRSLKIYNSIKHYITAEDYSTVRGASEAHRNIRDFLKLYYLPQIICIEGSSQENPHLITASPNNPNSNNPTKTTKNTIRVKPNHPEKRVPVINNLNNLLVRKKPRI
ncbi:H3 histone acetyltransferase RTT109 Ecym_8275 [Eremothecium cymbalariae DBVPG|uniref:histone acetyltransferase n=1 Tax=Eremothecium cymbalariae (strain CBS 270.75 / DBVPG 7215 / KCTC 17166 / NRRL Y-17582) TaxID=931890 RepID=G8JXI3_ERECY|nr:Hypothetical protein Ecym_8275 [Eremothecium cymbalariae DBVPG\